MVKKEIFKPTKMEKKVGVEEELDVLRSLLNKLVDSNYDEQQDKIISCIKSIMDMDTEDPCSKIIERIYLLIINNQRYSKIYANLVSSLFDEILSFELFHDIFVDRYNESIRNIEYADPDDNYDEYCRINKFKFPT